MRVTILMPVYNAAHYLHQSINSVLKQSCNSWEMIIIDDESTDNSRDIIQEYVNKDSRIRLITQKNAGPAIARARAIQLATTEYVAILDADDELSPLYVEEMLDCAKKYNADIITPNVEYISEQGSINRLTRFEESTLHANKVITNGQEAFSLTLPWQLHGWQMIKTSLAKKYYIENLVNYSKLNSDEYITRLLYLKSNTTVCCKAIYRHRFDNPDSLTRSFKLLNFDCLKTLDKLTELCIQEHMSIRIFINLYNTNFITLKNMINALDKLPAVDKNKGIEIIKNYYYKSYRKKFPSKILFVAPIKTSIKLFISMIDYKIMKLISTI